MDLRNMEYLIKYYLKHRQNQLIQFILKDYAAKTRNKN
jgi:hypothetical protein